MAKKIRILILGKIGMLGHLVFDYLKSTKKYDVFAVGREELNVLTMSEQNIENVLKKYSPNYVINAVGLINKSPELNEINAKKVNSDFPHLLAYFCLKNSYKLIHISTDCYLDEDIYGKSKYFGEVNDKKNITIRTSIIGPELNETGQGLFNWFMNQKEEVRGFTEAYWDGITTLQLARFIEDYMDRDNNKIFGIIDYRTKYSLDKYNLLKLISNIFNKKINIIKDDRPIKDKRNLHANFWCNKDYKIQIEELEKYMKKNPAYKRYFLEEKIR